MVTTRETNPHETSNFIFDAFCTAGIAGSVTALFFLLVDVVRGIPFFTTTVVGTLVFEGSEAGTITTVNMGLVPALAMVHFLVFGLLGVAISITVHEVEMRASHPAVVLGAIFILAQLAFVAVAALYLQPVLSRIGLWPVVVGNLVTCAAVGAFLLAHHRPQRWARLISAMRLARG